MTPQQIDAMKLALEALEDRSSLMKWQKARDAINEALAEHAMSEVQRLGQEIESDEIASILACRDMLDAQPVPPRTEQEPVAYPDGNVVGPCICGSWPGGKCLKCPRNTTPPQPERHELQAKGEHPAPCARHCEANAFQIVIKNLKAQLAQPEQEPVSSDPLPRACNLAGVDYQTFLKIKAYMPVAPPQRTEQLKACVWCWQLVAKEKNT